MSINVLTVPALREISLELVPRFVEASNHDVLTVFTGTDDILKRMKTGDDGVDLIILDAGSIDELTRLGKVVADTRIDLATSRIGVAVRAGAPRPDIGSVEALKRALLSASSVAYSRSLSGVHVAGLLQKWGIVEELQAKIRQPAPGEFVGEMLARGEAEIGFQQISELVHIAGIDFIGPIPADIQLVTVVSGAVHAGAKQPGPAKAWMEFLASPAAAPVLKKNGLEPA
jgi:molybdate transport system substrate-binding protein